jgi:hypothetical protein
LVCDSSKIDDGQTAVPHTERTVNEHPGAVRPSVSQCIAHRGYQAMINGVTVQVQQSSDAAHSWA